MELINRSNNANYEMVNSNDNINLDETSKNQFRFVDKNGRINVNYSSVGRIKNMHANVILFIMQTHWWLVLTFVLFSFVLSWFFFATLYFLISIEHGDFVINEENEIPMYSQLNSTQQYLKVEREKCVQDVHNFLSALLFSIETQHTIGYGSRYITTECMGGILVLTLQSSLGYLLQVIVTQIVFTKLSRPTEKSQFIIFSNYALVALRNNQLTLSFRIGNLSTSQLIFASVRLLMIRQRKTSEGEMIPHQIYDMELKHLRNNELFFLRPTIIEHVINQNSPLHGIRRLSLDKEHFEIIAIIEGIFEHTGFSCHFRTSYLPSELLWNYQFSSCDHTLSGFDFEGFNHVHLVDVIPYWNTEDNDFNDGTDISSGSSYICHKNSVYTHSNGKLEGQSQLEDVQPPNKRHKRLSSIE